MRAKKTGKVILIIVGVLAILLVIAALIANPILEDRIAKLLRHDLGKNYSIEFEELQVNVFSEKIDLKGVSLHDGEELLQMELSHLEIDNIGIFHYLFNPEELRIGEILLENGEVRLYKSFTPPSDSTKSPTSKIKSALIKNLKIKNTDFTYLSPKDSMALIKVKNFTFSGEKILLDLHQQDSLRHFLSFEGFDGHFEEAIVNTIENHDLSIDSLYFSHDGSLDLKGVTLASKASVKESKYRDTEKDIRVNAIRLPIDWDRMVYDNYLHIDHAFVYGVEAEFYLNKRKPNPPDHAPKLLHEILMAVNYPYAIDSVSVRNMDVTYRELAHKTDQAGRVFFTDMDIFAANITNDTSLLKERSNALIDIDAMLMGAAEVNIHVNYDLLAAAGNHHITGHLENFDITRLNQAFQPLEKIKFEKGDVKKLTFDMHFTEEKASGEVVFLYRQLKLNLKEMDSANSMAGEALGEIASFFANTFAIRHNNWEGSNPIKGEVDFERHPQKSFLNFWWKALFTGMKDTMLRIS
jgi:hypothetical protein